MIHPGLLFNDITLTEGYKNRTKTPWSTWEAYIKNVANSALTRNYDDATWRMYQKSNYTFQLALYYHISQDVQYANKAIEALLKLDIGAQAYKFERSDGVMYYSFAYDLMQPYLTSVDNTIIRDKLATLANQVYFDLNDGGTNLSYISFADYHGKAYFSIGIPGYVLNDYINPNNLPLTSNPSDWLRAGTEYLFENDLLHNKGTSLILCGFDKAGKHLSGAYKAYSLVQMVWWFQIYSFVNKKSIYEVYPIAKECFNSEMWETMPNKYVSNFCTSGNTGWFHNKGNINLLNDIEKRYYLNYVDKVETLKLLPNSQTMYYIDIPTLYLFWSDYSTTPRTNPAWTNHFHKDAVYQTFRSNWNEDSDWLSLITWAHDGMSNRNNAHHDQMSFEYYSRGNLLLSDGGEVKYLPDNIYGEYETFHNTIAIENPRIPYTTSIGTGSTSRGIYKGNVTKLYAISTITNVVESSQMDLLDVDTNVSTVIGDSWSVTSILSSPIKYNRTILYPNKDYFIIIDRMEGTEPWVYRNIFRPSSLNITPTTGTIDSLIGNVNVNLSIDNNQYDWLSLPYKIETPTGINTNSIKWDTINPYGNNVHAQLFSSPSSDILITKLTGRIAGYSIKSEVYNPVVYFKPQSTNNLYRVTVLLSNYDTEEIKIPLNVPVTGIGNAVKVLSSIYEDYAYSGKGISYFDMFSTDADTVYIRNTSSPISYTLINGKYLKQSGSSIIETSNVVEYLTLKTNELKTEINIKVKSFSATTINISNILSISQILMNSIVYLDWSVVDNILYINIPTGENVFDIYAEGSIPTCPTPICNITISDL